MSKKLFFVAVLLSVFGLVSCGGGGEDSESSGGGSLFGAGSETSGTLASPESCADPENLPLKKKNKLIVATGEMSLPWLDGGAIGGLGNLVPGSGHENLGFEGGIVYRIASLLNLEEVEWVTTGPNDYLSSSEKDYDFSIQRHAISDSAQGVVNFSLPYYPVPEVLISTEDNELVYASSLLQFKDINPRLGALQGSESLDYLQNEVPLSTPANEYENVSEAIADFDSGQLDGFVVDLITAYDEVLPQTSGLKLIGILPINEETKQLGIAFEADSNLLPCVNRMMKSIDSGGFIDTLERKYLLDNGRVEYLSGVN